MSFSHSDLQRKLQEMQAKTDQLEAENKTLKNLLAQLGMSVLLDPNFQKQALPLLAHMNELLIAQLAEQKKPSVEAPKPSAKMQAAVTVPPMTTSLLTATSPTTKIFTPPSAKPSVESKEIAKIKPEGLEEVWQTSGVGKNTVIMLIFNNPEAAVKFTQGFGVKHTKDTEVSAKVISPDGGKGRCQLIVSTTLKAMDTGALAMLTLGQNVDMTDVRILDRRDDNSWLKKLDELDAIRKKGR